MDVAAALAGAALVAAGWYDMFRTILNPQGRGTATRLLFRGLWRLSRATGHRIGAFTGPGAMGIVVVAWVLSQVVGWALVYLPHVPGGFSYTEGVDPSRYHPAAEALYISLVNLTTLGLGDVVPTVAWVRVVAPLEALAGFALLTAALSWFSQVYPALSRRRALALRLAWLGRTGFGESMAGGPAGTGPRALDELSEHMAETCVTLVQNAETFYFHDPHPDMSLARQLPVAIALRDRALAAEDDALRQAGRRLAAALDDLADVLVADFRVAGGDTEQVLTHFARQHLAESGDRPPRRRGD